MLTVFVAVAVVAAILAIYAGGGWALAVAWNTVAPLFWAAAPHLEWFHGVAALIVISTLRGLLTVNVRKS